MVRQTSSLVKQTVTEWINDDAMRLSASLAYYTLFSLAPLLLVMVVIVRWVLGDPNAQERMLTEIGGLAGTEVATAMESLMESSQRDRGAGWWGVVVGMVTVLLGASAAFNELRYDLNRIWNVEPPVDPKWTDWLKKRLFAFLVVLGVGLLMAVSFAASATLTAAGEYFSDRLPVPPVVLQAWNLTVSLGVLTVLFALLFKVLPDIQIDWRDVWLGAAVTAVLFLAGRTAITQYLVTSGISSSFGAAGSVVALLAFLYYSTLIFFLGAEFTQVAATRRKGGKEETAE
jgi:membrane protein